MGDGVTEDVIDYDKKFSLLQVYRIIFLVVFVLVIAKAGPAFNLDIGFILGCLILGFTLLSFAQPPVAVALLLTSNYLIGQVSIAYPVVSVLSILTVVVALALLLTRWRQGILSGLFHLRRIQIIGIGALLLVFVLGFVRTLQTTHAGWLGLSSDNSLLSVFTASIRGRNELAHYQFLAHWLGFIALGTLACTNAKELKIFLTSFILLYIVVLVALPFSFWPFFFKKIYLECEALGLSLGNVNRSVVGYMAAITSACSLAFAQGLAIGKRPKVFFYAWSLLAAVIVMLAGSKGPVLAWVLASAVVFYLAGKAERIRVLKLGAAVIVVVILTSLAGASIIPCGTVKQYAGSKHSITTRIDELRRAPDSRFDRIPVSRVGEAGSSGKLGGLLFGYGFGASGRSLDRETGLITLRSSTLNFLVDLYIEIGVIGLALFLTGGSLIMYYFFRHLRTIPSRDRRVLVAAIGAWSVVLLVKLMVSADTHTEDLVALLIGLFIGTTFEPPRVKGPTS